MKQSTLFIVLFYILCDSVERDYSKDWRHRNAIIVKFQERFDNNRNSFFASKINKKRKLIPLLKKWVNILMFILLWFYTKPVNERHVIPQKSEIKNLTSLKIRMCYKIIWYLRGKMHLNSRIFVKDLDFLYNYLFNFFLFYWIWYTNMLYSWKRSVIHCNLTFHILICPDDVRKVYILTSRFSEILYFLQKTELKTFKVT